jgi:hypothetical protein
MNRFNDSRRANGGADFSLAPPLHSSASSEQDRNMYYEDSMTGLNHLPNHWDLPMFDELPRLEIEKSLSSATSLTSSDIERNYINVLQPEHWTQLLEDNNQVTGHCPTYFAHCRKC